MSKFININGKLLPGETAGVSPSNRAFRYGYGLFETMLVREGRIRLERYHWERLLEGMALLSIQHPKYFREELAREVVRTVQKNKLAAFCRVRLQVCAGNGGYYDGDDFDAQYVIETFSLEAAAAEWNENGLIAGISDIIKPTGAYAHLKTCSTLPYILAARQAKAALWNDALLLNERGNVADSTIANIFWIDEGTVCTTPLSEGCVGGVMRRHLLETLPHLGIKVAERVLQTGHFPQLDSVFLCNAIRGVKWLKAIGNHGFQPEKVRDLWKMLGPSLL